MTEIGAFEAKTHFSRLLDRARRGEAFTITHRGVAVAKLVPIRDERGAAGAREALGRLRDRASDHLGAPISMDEIFEWKSTGRR
ncbi:MAG: type II toxin-antitoxin system prevent-host-death family antitoxin [Caulobacteraceae bacterium]